MFFRRWSLTAVVALFLGLSGLAGHAAAQSAEVPTPELKFVRSEQDTTRDAHRKFHLNFYWFEVANRDQYPAELFDAAPDLPPCGLNKQAGRLWLHFYDAVTNRRIYGYCAMKDASEMGKIAFGRQISEPHPEEVYIELHDRRTGIVLRSNSVTIPTAAQLAHPRGLAEQEIERLENEWNAVNEISDPGGKQRLLTDDSYHVGPSGRLYNKHQDITAARASRAQKLASGSVTRFIIADRRIRLYDGVAVVTGNGVSVVTVDGKQRMGNRFRFLHVWERRGTQWQISVDQVTGIEN